MKNLTTLILPRWYAILDELKLNEHIMPRDVSTCWNSTYNMLKFALDYCLALNAITGERDMKLQKYELNNTEWVIAKQLGDILEVFFKSRPAFNFTTISIIISLALKARHPLLFSSNTQHCNSHPCHGPSGSTPRYKCPRYVASNFYPCSCYVRQTYSQ